MYALVSVSRFSSIPTGIAVERRNRESTFGKTLSLAVRSLSLSRSIIARTSTVLKRQTKARLALVDKQVAELDREIEKLITADDTTVRRHDILRSIPGPGHVATAATLSYLPEIGTLDRRQISSLAGLAPYNRDSGKWKSLHLW